MTSSVYLYLSLLVISDSISDNSVFLKRLLSSEKIIYGRYKERNLDAVGI